MFRWLRERRQQREKEARERSAQLRDKVQTGRIAGARKQLSYYADGAATQSSDSVAQNFAMQLIAQEMAQKLSGSRDSDQQHHVTQVHHGSGDNIAGSASHGHHGYSSHDSGSYDSGSSSSGSDSSW
ncbi:hypothetical protein N5C79_20170 [Pantoea brenneri]|uniref:hypothetical protein n=1 Tax=Pantoea brenneri TaxID=472694 RepID=UPI00244B114B|nr:hypothetical protein [Pantoea brenneri]MDH1088821.1 hypothetical protein [Pantoea brenneri]